MLCINEFWGRNKGKLINISFIYKFLYSKEYDKFYGFLVDYI